MVDEVFRARGHVSVSFDFFFSSGQIWRTESNYCTRKRKPLRQHLQEDATQWT